MIIMLLTGNNPFC